MDQLLQGVQGLAVEQRSCERHSVEAIRDIRKAIAALRSDIRTAGDRSSRMAMEAAWKLPKESSGRALKRFHASISKFGKHLDKVIPESDVQIYRDVYWDSGAEDAMIVQHLYMSGFFDSAGHLVEAVPDGSTVALPRRDEYDVMHHILQCIRAGDYDPVRAWIARCHHGIELLGSPLEFHVDRTEFSELLQCSPDDGGMEKAMWLASARLERHYTRHAPEVQALCSAILWMGRIESSPYGHLVPHRTRRNTCEVFVETFTKLNGLPTQSHLRTTAETGLLSMGHLRRIVSVLHATAPTDAWDALKELPVEVPIDKNFHFHSIFSCPISRELAHRGNPPMLLQCGHTICRLSMDRISGLSSQFKCPTCPTMQRSEDAEKLVL